VILTLDLGTSTTKAVVWDGDGPRAVGRAPVVTTFPAGDRAEQDPAGWWPSVVAACAEARQSAPADFAAVEAVGFAAARQTFVGVTAAGEALGPAIVWSDRRAGAEAAVLAEAVGGVDALRARTGAVLDGGAVAAKAAWLARRQPRRWASARWLLTPRDFVVSLMTGAVVTDVTMVSAAGLVDPFGEPVAELMAGVGERLPPVVGPDTVVGTVAVGAAAELGLRTWVPVVIGAGDRACEVLGTSATDERPMVSWGTTANISLPAGDFPGPVPRGLAASRGADGWLLEGGLSGAGSLLGWLSTLTGLGTETLMRKAATAPAGAGGAVALPWFGGARAPWWRDRARGGFVGLSFDHDAGHLARAVVESVAWEVLRCLRAAGAVPPDGPVPATSLWLTGDHAAVAPWPDVVTAVTGLPARRRRSGQAASAGAALLAARATGADYDLERLDPMVATVLPDQSDVARYAYLRTEAEAAAAAVIGLEFPGAPTGAAP
jgi:xylulokinase